MFKILDGRTELWQWDLDVKLVVSDPTITEVHFCNRTDDCSLVVEVEEVNGQRIANIPNILLQESWPIRVYAFCGEKHTVVEQIYNVNKRTRPADYVYTETEVKTWEALEETINAAVAESGYYMPSVAEDGTLTWTPSKESMPAAPASFVVQGPEGPQGEKGDKGDKGDAPVKGVDYWTETDLAEITSEIEDLIDQYIISTLNTEVSV